MNTITGKLRSVEFDPNRRAFVTVVVDVTDSMDWKKVQIDGATVTVDGKTMSFSELKRWLVWDEPEARGIEVTLTGNFYAYPVCESADFRTVEVTT